MNNKIFNPKEAKFFKEAQNRIDNQSREKQPFFFGKFSNSNPVFIPKKRKKK